MKIRIGILERIKLERPIAKRQIAAVGDIGDNGRNSGRKNHLGLRGDSQSGNHIRRHAAFPLLHQICLKRGTLYV